MPLLAEVASCHEGVVRLRAGSLLGHRRPKGEEGASSYTSLGMPRPAKGTAASTSSQPQAVMDSSADTSAPLASRLAGGENLEKSSSIGHTLSNEAVLTRATPDRNQSAPGAGAPTGDFWERSGQHEPRRVPGHGAPPSKSSSKRRRPVNEAVPTRITPDRNQSAPGAGTPTGALEAKRTARAEEGTRSRGALIEVVFQKEQARQRSRSHQNDTRHEPKRTGSGYPHRRFLGAKRTA